MKRVRLDNGVAIAALCAYACNRYLVSFDFFLPYEIAHYHFGDFCGGVVFPAYVNWLTRLVIGKDVITTFPRELLCGLVCAFAWEVAAPAVLSFSTGDPLDVIAYLLGFLVHCVVYKIGVHLDSRSSQPAA